MRVSLENFCHCCCWRCVKLFTGAGVTVFWSSLLVVSSVIGGVVIPGDPCLYVVAGGGCSLPAGFVISWLLLVLLSLQKEEEKKMR